MLHTFTFLSPFGYMLSASYGLRFKNRKTPNKCKRINKSYL